MYTILSFYYALLLTSEKRSYINHNRIRCFISDILDVHYNLGRVEQVIGRAVRMCKHQAVITKDNFFPEVNVYRYVVSFNSKDKLSSDEVLYQKAEKNKL